MTQHHPIRWIILLALPLVLLLGWFVVEQSPSWFSAVPAWLRPTSPDAVTGACEALAAVEAYGGSFDGDLPWLGLTAPDALAAAREAAANAYEESLPPSAFSQPVLVWATFPNAGNRIAWMTIATLAKPPDARFDRAGILFIDADNGELLALHTANSVTDAAAACGSGPVSRRALVRQYLPLLLTAAYVGLVGVGLLLRRWWTRRTRKAV